MGFCCRQSVWRSWSVRFGAVAHSIVPVSYTHLDVYKRQVDQYLGRIQAPYQNAAGGNGILWIAGNPHGLGKELLYVSGADGCL